MPEGFTFFPQLLRRAGYYTSNSAKEDYNLEKPGRVWDESSRQAHWRNRPEGTAFFSVFNFAASHESQIRLRPHTQVHDPSSIRVPAYHPDTPEVRRDWAQYYDKMTEVDMAIGRVLDQLAEDGLIENTIVFYWGDHGVGLPRGKRTAMDSGLRVPLIVSIPERLRHLAPKDWMVGGVSDRLVSFVDFAPTVLSLAGVEIPSQYQGRAFLGTAEGLPKSNLFGFRGRMDERIDMVRTVTDGRYVYVRNYMPHRPHGQHVWYEFQTPTTQVWRRLWEANETTPAQSAFWLSRRPAEELYDLASDPDEVVNLSGSGDHAAIKMRLKQELVRHMVETRDLGLLPEAELRERARTTSPWELAQSPEAYPLEVTLAAAETATSSDEGDSAALLGYLKHADAAVRFWGALGFLHRGAPEGLMYKLVLPAMARALDDPSPAVAITAAEYNVRHGGPQVRDRSLDRLLDLANMERSEPAVVWQALNALDYLGELARPRELEMRTLPTSLERTPPWAESYVPRLVEKTLDDLVVKSGTP